MVVEVMDEMIQMYSLWGVGDPDILFEIGIIAGP